MRVWPGVPYPQGATWDGEGVNFSIFSEHATAVELCLFDKARGRGRSRRRIRLTERTDLNWHVLPAGRAARASSTATACTGPGRPSEGHRFNPAKLLLDPYAKAISGKIRWDDTVFGYTIGDPDGDLPATTATAPARCRRASSIDPAFTWGDDRPPAHAVEPDRDLRVRTCEGLTSCTRASPRSSAAPTSRMASDPILDHLPSLGVTAVELLPVHHFVNDRDLVERGLTNYWGYNSIGFFAPEVRLRDRRPRLAGRASSSRWSRRLHRAGIEVILDVVYNHTGEGNHLGPTLVAARRRQRRLLPARCRTTARYYMDFTGTGNSLNMLHPRTIQLIMDSLRYWVLEMHVDGFRFDLAPVLARELYEVNRLGTFFDIIQQDPVLSQVKLIAEPWDVGPGGYQVGNFPVGWAEWNGKYRDCVRRFWSGEPGQLARARVAARRDRATCTRRAAATPTRASTSSPRTTASRSPTW